MKNLFIIFILFFLCSCGTINKLKHKQTTKSDSVEVVKSNTKTETTTAATLTTTERLDTSLQGKQDSAVAKSDLIKLQNGDTNKVNTGTIEIDTYIDKKENKIITKVKTKPAPIHAFIDKKTVEVKKEQKKEQKQENKKVEVKKKEEINDKTIHKEAGGISTGIIITLSLLLLLIILYLYLRTKFKFLP